MERPVAGRRLATAPRYDPPPAGVSPGAGVEEETSAARPRGMPRSEGIESICRIGVCTTTG